jgi:hypothetical protein
VSFAQPLRDMLHALGVPYTSMWAAKELPLEVLCGKTPRYALQTLGTEWGRKLIGNDIWVAAAHRAIQEKLRRHGMLVVLDDVRFDNEANVIHDLGGMVVRIKRPGYEYSTVHASERGVSPELVDETIEAEGLAQLRERVEKFLNWPEQLNVSDLVKSEPDLPSS